MISDFNWETTLRENCPYLELFWSAFSHIRTEYGEIRSIISPYSVRMRENAYQNNSEYGHFLRSATLLNLKGNEKNKNFNPPAHCDPLHGSQY